MSDKPPKAHRVYFGATEEGVYIAASVHTPAFCFLGDSEAEVRSKAERALNFYFNTPGVIVNQPSRVSTTKRVVSFIPQKVEEIEYAEA
jgi:hypothetical protein